MCIKNNDFLRKKLYFRSSHRGMKELDLLLGNFAQDNLNTMNSIELSEFEEVLNISDQNLYLWYMNKEEVPKQFLSKTLVNLLNYKISK